MSTHTYPASLVRVINADTLEVNLDLGLGLISRQRLQLLRVNAPEDGQPGAAEAAAFVANFLTSRYHADITVTVHNQDSFGRWLSEVSVDNRSLNDALAQHLGTGASV